MTYKEKRCPCGITSEAGCYNCPESPFVRDWILDKYIRERERKEDEC